MNLLYTFCYIFSATTYQCYHTNTTGIMNNLMEFNSWAEKYKMTEKWKDGNDITELYNNWNENKKFVENHNKNNNDFKLELNQFAHIHHEKWAIKTKYNKHLSNKVFNEPTYKESERGPIFPKSLDWREMGIVTPVKNQAECGSCWSFSATGSMEGQFALKTGNLVALSESQIIDCDLNGTDEGCSGGLMDGAFKYVIEQGGIESEENYPYFPEQGICKFNRSRVVAHFKEFVDVHGGEAGLKKAVATVGPISVAIDASVSSFQFYKSGVYYEPTCSTTMLDHGVLVVGYGTTADGSDYWIVKNSWSSDWGLDGYILMARNRNNSCGIATQPSYPVFSRYNYETA